MSETTPSRPELGSCGVLYADRPAFDQAKDDLAPEYVRSLLSYDPETGDVRWRVNRCARAKAGDLAGSRHTTGYRRVMIDGKNYTATRIAWVIMTGGWPSGVVDHKDGDPTNDRWSNLRVAPRWANLANSKVRSNCKSGFKGVCQTPAGTRWVAYFHVAGRTHYLGSFLTIEEAVAARAAVAAKWHGEFARSK